MSRPKTYQSAKRVQLLMEESDHALAVARLKSLGIDSFSEYVGRLVRADMKNKGSAALRVARFSDEQPSTLTNPATLK
jgi:hypothetical protein